MERAAFKFTAEYLEVLGGKDSVMYEEFIVMFTKGLQAARKYATVTITMMEIMMFKVIVFTVLAVLTILAFVLSPTARNTNNHPAPGISTLAVRSWGTNCLRLN